MITSDNRLHSLYLADAQRVSRRRQQFTVPLNAQRKHQYVAAFAQRFELIKDYCLMREGEELLTTQIAVELSDYSRDELTCATYAMMARKAL
jgi:hypothetical protein